MEQEDCLWISISEIKIQRVAVLGMRLLLWSSTFFACNCNSFASNSCFVYFPVAVMQEDMLLFQKYILMKYSIITTNFLLLMNLTLVCLLKPKTHNMSP